MMDHKQTMGVNSRVLDQKQLNIFGRISLFWSVELQGHPKQLNGGEHDWLIQTLASTVQRGMLVRQGDIDKVLRSRANQKCWMALDCGCYCHRMPQGTVWSSA